MADSNIGSLPQAASLDDDSLLVAEQQGQAVKITGAQFKEFGRQAVIGQVQGYVDQAEAAADRAVDAVSAVTDMTVEAATLPSGQNATVEKTTKNGKVNLKFGLPRGEQGIPGPEGKQGPRGAKGDPGDGLTILGHYDTEAALRAAVTAPKVGDAYSVGTELPYDTYIFDGVIMDWKNHGPLSGGGGSLLPENVVTAEGGASMSFPIDLGDGPHTITFEAEEEPPLTAEDIEYSETQSVKDVIDDLKSSVSDGKALVASAITDKGIPTAQDATFAQMADNIGQISSGGNTSDATATSFDILAGKTAYTAAGKVEGVIPTLLGQTIIPGTADKTIANGQYLGGTQVIKGDPNLTSGNIKSGVTLFGVEGALESKFQATLTVTADAGAVVTATHTNGTKVEGLSTSGTVVLELPLEGTWKVTAVRGVAQYNTVTIQASSQYSAALTAEVHVEYFGEANPLSEARKSLAAASTSNHAIFASGQTTNDQAGTKKYSYKVDVYDKNLTMTNPSGVSIGPGAGIAAASAEERVFFAGGYNDDFGVKYQDSATTIDKNMVKQELNPLSKARAYSAAAAVGDKFMVGGGKDQSSSSSVVDAYNAELTHTTPVGFPAPVKNPAAAANENYAIFYGDTMCAYNEALTRSLPSALSVTRNQVSAARAGNYVLFAGGSQGSSMSYPGNVVDTVDAYDLFLTRTTVEALSVARNSAAGTTLKGFALFAGGGLDRIAGRGTVEVDYYDPYLVHTRAADMKTSRVQHAAASVGEYALFGGGIYGTNNVSYSPISNVEAYRYV